MSSIPKRKNSLPPYRTPLILLSMRVRAGTINDKEREVLANILLQLGYGKTLNQALGVRRGRPIDPERDGWVYNIAIAALPVAHGGRGLTVQDAIEQESVTQNKSYETIEKAWKSRRGRIIRHAVKRNAPKGYEIGPI